MGRKKYKGPIFGPFFFKINKPVGISSFDVIRKLKQFLPPAIGKIGHFGTLDPFADGLMLVGIGPATRLNTYSQGLVKEYIATGKFGVSSVTGDNTAPEDGYFKDDTLDDIGEDKLTEVMKSFVGPYMQVPHSYSATKHEGKALYEWAREGKTIVKDPVKRQIYEIELLDFNQDSCRFRVKVSSGTYIRVLFEDIAKKLNTLGHLSSLTRTEVGPHLSEDAFDLSDIDGKVSVADFLEKHALSIDTLVKFPELILEDKDAHLFGNGVRLTRGFHDGVYWIKSTQGEVLGLGNAQDGVLVGQVIFSPAAPSKIDLSILKNPS
jgi:tRNA pseudouridine55 synthase